MLPTLPPHAEVTTAAVIPSTNSPAPPDTNAAPAALPPNPTAPALRWTARADWIDAEDGTIVAARPSFAAAALGGGLTLNTSDALWPARRGILATAPAMLAALEALVAIMPDNTGEGDDPEQDAAWVAARAAIAQARASW